MRAKAIRDGIVAVLGATISVGATAIAMTIDYSPIRAKIYALCAEVRCSKSIPLVDLEGINPIPRSMGCTQPDRKINGVIAFGAQANCIGSWQFTNTTHSSTSCKRR